jgi:hypothetical protein
MFANTGAVSFWLYGIFILFVIVAVVVVYFLYKKKPIQDAQIEKLTDLFKVAILGSALTTIGLIVTDLFKERDQDVRELEYFGKYVEDVKRADGVEARWQLARYLSIVAPSGEMKKSWENYFNYIDTGEYRRYRNLLALNDSLVHEISNNTFVPEEKQNEMKKVRESIQMYEKPLVNSGIQAKAPVIYIQYCNRDAKGRMLEIQDKFNSNSWNAPGIEYLQSGCYNSIRYFHDEDRALADEANQLLDNNYNIKRSYIKAPKGQIELWAGD